MLQNDTNARLIRFLKSGGTDSSGKQSFNGIFGEKYTALRKPKFSANFCYPSSTRSVTNTTANGESAAFTFTSTGTSDIEFTNRWSEQF